MPTIRFEPSGTSVTVAAGTTLLAACQEAGLGIPATCGGKGLCGKCRVRILEGEAPAHTGFEQALSPSEVASGWRLACLIRVETDLVVDTGDGGQVQSVILTDITGRDVQPDGAIRAVKLHLPEPSLEDQTCDMGRIMRALGMTNYPHCALSMMQTIPDKLREAGFAITAFMHGKELLGIEPLQENPRVFGMALDIGTTTVVGALFDLTTGDALAVASRTNPQAVHGDDVVSRIGYAGQDEEGRRELQTLVVDALNEIIAEACEEVQAHPHQVYFFAACGNTTMHHLLLGLDPRHIAESPFIAGVRHALLTRASHVGLGGGPGAQLYALPNISAYVGGDIVSGLLAHEVHDSNKTLLLIDVGTNGEMALRADGTTHACATAAGPAFEGARISCGMRAATGAITTVEMGDEDIRTVTVDQAPARGLCGTGLLDAVALLLDLGIVDETGRMAGPEADGARQQLPPAICQRIITEGEHCAFILAHATNGYPQITLTQRDVREFQLAKGAIAAGVQVILNAVGKSPSDVDQVYLAGGFGSYLRPKSALRVGLLPEDIARDKVRAVGNAALAGARLCLLSQTMRDEAETIGKEVAYMELSGRTDFQEAFSEQMLFPEG